jgi:hypothetical protein
MSKIKINISVELKKALRLFIRSNSCKVSKLLLDSSDIGVKKGELVDECKYDNYFSFSTTNPDRLSCVTYSKITQHFNKRFNTDNIAFDIKANTILHELYEEGGNLNVVRTSFKPGKVLSKIFNSTTISPVMTSDYELFTNNIKAYNRYVKLNFKVVKGKDINYWYEKINYESYCDPTKNYNRSESTLYNSCMNKSDKNHYMDIYADNQDKVSLLIATNENDKLIGRALLWEGVEFISINYIGNLMDRIYFDELWMISAFKMWAIEHNYYTKTEQKFNCLNNFTSPIGESFKSEASIKLDNIRYRNYPYFDTFTYPVYEKNTFSNTCINNQNTSLRIPDITYDFICKKYNTEFEWLPEENTYADPVDIIEHQGIKYHKSKCQLDKSGGYIIPGEETDICIITKNLYSKRNLVYSFYHKGMVSINDSVYYNKDYVHNTHLVYSNVTKQKLLKKDTIKSDSGEYLPKDILDKYNLSANRLLALLGDLNLNKQENDNLAFLF